MNEQLYPALQGPQSEAHRPLIQSAEQNRTNFILNKQKDLEEKLEHYRKLITYKYSVDRVMFHHIRYFNCRLVQYLGLQQQLL